VDVSWLLREYDLGPVIDTGPLAGGSAAVLRVRTERGAFVLKPAAGQEAGVELQARVAAFLCGRGIRQARVIRTLAGRAVSADGCFVQEYLPGAIVTTPTAAQTLAAMHSIGAYHRELAGLADTFTPDAGSLWQRVADPDHLVRALPELLARYQVNGPAELAAVRVLDLARPQLATLPRQVVHGDLGPDNVLMDGDEVVSIIDFTPHRESVLVAGCSALYWYHIYGQPEIDTGWLRASVAAIGAERPWSAAELELWPAGVVREALRRLATTLELAAESGREPGPSLAPRRMALLNVVRAFDLLCR
jgi:Ser/Thr protein kinase RdoA (MazF antagonist)